MKRLFWTIGILALCGCASISVTKVAPDGTKTTMTAKTLFSNTAVKGLTLDGTTKTTTNLLKVAGSTTEPNPEAITASASALGELVGAAAATAAKGVK